MEVKLGPSNRIVTFQIQPFYTSMIVGQSVMGEFKFTIFHQAPEGIPGANRILFVKTSRPKGSFFFEDDDTQMFAQKHG